MAPRTRQTLTITIAFAASLWLGGWTMAYGQTPQITEDGDTTHLSELVSEVRANNPSLRAERLGADALALRSPQVSALPDPSVMLAYQPFPLLTARGTQRTQWRLEQMIPFPGKRDLKGKIADLGADVARFRSDALEQDLIHETKSTYYEIYRIQEQIALVESFQQQLTGFENAAAVQYQVGTGMQQSIQKAQLERNMLSQRLISLRQARRSQSETLARLLNRQTGELDIEELAAPEIPNIDRKVLIELALDRRPEASALATSLQQSERRIALARRNFLPDFGLNITYFDIGRSDIIPSATGRDALSIGASVKIPLQLGSLRARLQESRVRRNEIQARREALEINFETRISDLLNAMAQERAQMDLYRDLLVPQAEATLEATLGTYTTGRSDFLDLLDAERMLFTLKSGLVDSYSRFLKTAAALERALGIEDLSELTVR